MSAYVATESFGAPLFDKAMIYECSEMPEGAVFEFPETISSTRRDHWLSLTKEIILLHRFLSENKVQASIQAWEIHGFPQQGEHDLTHYNSDMQKFRRRGLSSPEYPTSEYGATNDSGNASISSGELPGIVECLGSFWIRVIRLQLLLSEYGTLKPCDFLSFCSKMELLSNFDHITMN
ncbi:hypothetical protein Drorol1_Dr00004638 [Drosera rotundifolia]